MNDKITLTNKKDITNLMKRIIKKYEEQGMIADVLIWDMVRSAVNHLLVNKETACCEHLGVCTSNND